MEPKGRPSGKFTQHRRLDKLREFLLRNPKGATIYEMAAALGVTTRTMRRYLKEVEREFELESTPVRGGGPLLWKIPPREIPRKVDLRRTQVYALLAARKMFEPMRGSALHDEIEMASEKLISLSRRPGRNVNAGVNERLEDRFLYMPHAPKNYSDKTDELDDLFQAVADLRPLALQYKGAGKSEEEQILIHPYAMVLHRDSIYAVGYHTGKEEVRTFVLDRMRDTIVKYTEAFELPDDFNVEEYFQGELGVFKSKKKVKVVVEFDARGAEYARHRVVHPSQKLTKLAGGGLRLTMKVGNLNPVTSWVLEWGGRAKVVEPPELVERVQSELKEALANYAG